ncbi:MAG: SAM-dependent methyltransferase [Clostridia bacterium]|nr:SAM-dependent methyltransferase [Clostridia bacterium]
MLKLGSRLNMAAQMVRQGSRLADIGTDHAYLTASLILDGTVKSAIAADLRKGPLENAEATVISYGIADKVELRLSDGLTAILPEEADDIVIAGMGGILISEILGAAPWVKNEKYKLILQPQSHDEVLREWLWDNGFEITQEDACFDDGKAYICMSAAYTGVSSSHSEAEILLGGFADKTDEASSAFVERKLHRVRVRLDALKKSDAENDEIQVLQNIIDEVNR